MESDARTVRSYKKKPTIQVPAIPDYISPFLSQFAASSANYAESQLGPSSPDSVLTSSPTTTLSPLDSGDGASYAATLRLQKYLCSIPDTHNSFRNGISTPEIWHAKATMVNSIAANHYGPATSKDPSSLSRSSNIAGFKRPTNLNSCDYYPTVRSMTLIWEAQVLNCWRIFFDAKPSIQNRQDKFQLDRM